MIALSKKVPVLRLDSKGRMAYSSAVDEANFFGRGTRMSEAAGRKPAPASVARLPWPQTRDIKAVVQARLQERKNALDSAADADINSDDLSLNFPSIKEAVQAMLKNAGKKLEEADAHTVVAYIREQLENIENPNRALELELARLVEAKTPPNTEYYSTRHDKSELAVAFFHRVYGRFYKQGVLYKHQLRAIDASLLNMLGHHSAEVQLKTKKDFNTTIASRAMTVADSVKTAVLSVSRRQYA